MTIVITPAELAELLDGPNPPLLLDVRWQLSTGADSGGRPDVFAEGHIPAARFVDLDAELSSLPAPDGVGGRHPLPREEDFQAAMRRAGVTDERPVVCYDQKTSIAAARLWWLLTDAGHTDVHVLDGGYEAWVAAGYPVEEGAGTAAMPSEWQGRPGQRQRADADAVQTRIAAGGRVVDVRAGERFRGEKEPIDPVAGHIPGADNVPATELQAADGTFLPAEQVRARMGELAEGDILSCGSGITASQALLALENAGVTGLQIYPGSWSDWCARGLPVERG